MKSHLLFLVVTLILSACAPTADPPAATETLTPTSAIVPTSTSTRTLTPNPPTRAPSATPDYEATMDPIADAVKTAGVPRLHASYPSPDGQWRAEIIIYDCVQVGELDSNAYEELRLIEVSTGETEVVDSQLQYCGGLGAAGLDGRFWSDNSRYFYYTDAREGVPDGGCGYWEPSLRRLDTADASKEELGMGPLSPDETKLATWQDSDIVVWSLDEGEIGRAPALPADAVRGPVAWSPDGEALIYLQTEDYCFPFGTSYVVRLDLPELEPELLIESSEPAFIGVTWDQQDRIRLSDEEGNAWTYDFETGELQPGP